MKRETKVQKSQKNVKNILIASTSSDYGGGPKVVFDFLSHVNSNKFTYIVVAPEGIYLDKFKSLGLKVYRLPLNKLNLKTFWDFYNILKKEKVGLVNSHGKGAGLYARIASILAGVPVVHTFHGIHVEQQSKIAKIIYICLERALSIFTFKIVNVSKSQENQGFTLGLFPKNKSVVIYNGVAIQQSDKRVVDKTQFRQKLGLTNKSFVLTMVARFDPVKGHERLVKLLPNIAMSIPLKVLLVGDGEKQAITKVLVKNLGLKDKVRFLGFRSDVTEILKISDALIIPSFREGLPTVVLEAMACNLPTIGAKTIGIDEVVKDKKTGFLIDFEKNPDAFADVVYKLYSDPELRKKMGDEARNEAEKNYSGEKFVSATEKLYKEILVKG